MGIFGGAPAAGIEGSENEKSEREIDSELECDELGTPDEADEAGEDADGCGMGAVSAVTGVLTGGSAEGAFGRGEGSAGTLGRAPMDEGALGAERGMRGGSGGFTLPERGASGSGAVTSFEPLTELFLSLMGTGLTQLLVERVSPGKSRMTPDVGVEW